MLLQHSHEYLQIEQEYRNSRSRRWFADLRPRSRRAPARPSARRTQTTAPQVSDASGWDVAA